MQALKNTSIIEFVPGQLEAIRKEFKLNDVERMNEAIDILDTWVKQQNHFVKKDFDRDYLERTIITTKGSVEQAKARVDKLFTFRTLMPEFFEKVDVHNDFGDFHNVYANTLLPKPTKEHNRVFLHKVLSNNFTSTNVSDFFKFGVIVAEYLKLHDYVNGFVLVFDYRDLNVMDLVTRLNPLDLQKAHALFTEAYGMRIRGIHIITASKVIDSLVSIVKQTISAKVASRLHVHKGIEALYDHMPKEILPKEYGGNEKPLSDLTDAFIEVLGSEKHIEYLKEMNRSGTDESRRTSGKLNDQYLGMPGTFRTLNVD